MKRIVFSIMIILVGVWCCVEGSVSNSSGAIVGASGKAKKTSKELAEYIKLGIKEKGGRLKAAGKLSADDERLMKLLADDESSAGECEMAVARYLRMRYLDCKTTPVDFRVIRSEHGLSVDDFATALFWLKGAPSGLYEYYRLSGMTPLSGQFVVDTSDDKSKHEMLLRFKLYLLIENLERAPVNRFVLDQPVGFSSRLETIKSLVAGYGDNKVLTEFILRYPFMDGCYVKVRARYFQDPRYRYDKIPSVEELLTEYCMAVVSGDANKLAFLGDVHKHYGRQCFSVVSRSVIDDPGVGGVSFYGGLVDLAADVRAWDVIGAILDKPEGTEAVASKRSVIDRVAGELASEQAMVGAITDVLNDLAKQ